MLDGKASSQILTTQSTLILSRESTRQAKPVKTSTLMSMALAKPIYKLTPSATTDETRVCVFG